MPSLLHEPAVEAVAKAKPRFASKTLFGTPAKRRTLDELIAATRNELAANRPAKCPSCGGVMRPVHARAHDVVVGGRCRNCGAALS